MVFHGIRTVYGLARQSAVVFVRVILMFCCKPGFDGPNWISEKKERNDAALSSIFASGGRLASVRLRASFTIEATLVLGVVFMSIAVVIQYAYTEHDKVTGNMILQEMLVRARADLQEEHSEDYFEEMGRQLGNPRLWMGEYEIEISRERNTVTGKASAGEWNKEIEIELFQPSAFLRMSDCFRDLTEGEGEMDDNGDRVQAGDEPELYGDSFGTGNE